jgi:hypothetical protein
MIRGNDANLLDTTASLKPSAFCDRSHLDPDANELCKVWQHTGTIPTHYYDFNLSDIDAQHIWLAYWPLMNAAIHGYTVRDVEFTDQVMDLLQKNVAHGVRPDLDTISQLFGEHHYQIPDVLRHFVVDRWVDAGVDQSDVGPFLPEVFLRAALKAALERLSCNRQSPHLSTCEYHSHARPEDCYRRAIVTVEAEAEDRQDDDQESNEKSDSIRDVDRGAHKAGAHQAMRDQSGMPWVGFRRFDQPTPRPQASSSLEDSDLLNRVIPPCPDTPDTHHNIVPPTSVMFGTAQTAGAVDDVRIEPPTREAPPPPSQVPACGELQEEATVAGREVLPASTDESYVSLRNDRPIANEQVDGTYSLPLLGVSRQPAPNDELDIVPENSSQAGKRVTCPGAFPESRSGSLRSVTTGQSSSLDAI